MTEQKMQRVVSGFFMFTMLLVTGTFMIVFIDSCSDIMLRLASVKDATSAALLWGIPAFLFQFIDMFVKHPFHLKDDLKTEKVFVSLRLLTLAILIVTGAIWVGQALPNSPLLTWSWLK
jgi:hypothetical protein